MRGLSKLRYSHTVRLIVTGSSWSLFLQVFSKLSVLVFTAVAAKSLGVADLGLFASVQAIGLLAAAVWDCGFSQFLLREVSAKPSDLYAYLGSAAKAKTIMLPAFFLVFIAGICTLGSGTEGHVAAIAILGLSSLCAGITQLLNASLQAELRFRVSATTSASGRVVTALLSILLLRSEVEDPFVALATMYLLGEVVVLVQQFMAVGPGRLQIGRQVSVVECMRDQRRAIPYALNGFFVLVYNRLDIVLVTWFSSAYQAGLYGPASRIQDAISFIPATLSAALTPIFSRSYADKRDITGITKAMFSVSLISAGLIILVIAMITVTANSIIPQVLGIEYLKSAEVTQVIVWALLFSAVAQPFFSLVVALGQARLLNWAYGTSLVVSLVGHALFVPDYGAIGGASVAIARDALGAAVGIGIAVALIKSVKNEAAITPA